MLGYIYYGQIDTSPIALVFFSAYNTVETPLSMPVIVTVYTLLFMPMVLVA
jgi:hypothetical protein